MGKTLSHEHTAASSGPQCRLTGRGTWGQMEGAGQAVGLWWPVAVSGRVAGSGVGPSLRAGESFVVGFSEDQAQSPVHRWSGGATGALPWSPWPPGTYRVGGERGSCVFWQPSEFSPRYLRALTAGPGWSVLFAQGGEARVAHQLLPGRLGQEGEGRRSGGAQRSSC